MSQLVTYALTTLARVKGSLGILDTSSDSYLTDSINQASAWAQNYCGGRNFMSQSYTEIYDTRQNSQKIFLRQRPVTNDNISGGMVVNYRSGIPTNPIWVLYDPNSYVVYKPEGYIHFYGMLPKVHQGLQITYTAGYLIDFTNEYDVTKHTLPEDLTWAVTQLVSREFNMRQAKGLMMMMTEGQRLQFRDTLDPDIQNVLDSYKTPHFAV